MGGKGSGNWWRFGKKPTVEQCLVVGMKGLRKRLYVGAAGTFTWTRASGANSSIGYVVTGTDHAQAVVLRYRWRGSESVRIPVGLTSTPAPFGGRRWWFLCPLSGCDRRSGKLYLPRGAKYFGCRKCHRLTYRSCQESHQAERLACRLGLSADEARLWERLRRRRQKGSCWT
jgi:hypothetical protein